ILPGENFHEVLAAKVANCKVLLAVIGRQWLEMLQARLSEEGDFVRFEIVEALRRRVPVIPVLIDGAELPSEVQLPDELKELSRRTAVSVRATTFRADADQLIASLRRFVGGALPELDSVHEDHTSDHKQSEQETRIAQLKSAHRALEQSKAR